MVKFYFIVLLPLTLMISGCFGVSSEFRDYQIDLVNHSGIKAADKEVELGLGRIQLYLAEKVTGVLDNDLLAEMIIQDISLFEIGVYESVNFETNNIKFSSYELLLKEKGWVKFIKTADGQDITNIYLKVENDDDEINELMVLATDSENTVLMRLKGNFNRVVDRLIKTRKPALI